MDHFFGFGTFKERFREFVGENGRGVEKFFPVFFRVGHEMGGNFGNTHFGSAVAFKIDGFHGYKIHHSFELVFKADGKLHHVGIESEFFTELHANLERIGSGTVALVYKGDTRNMVALELAVYRD